jgi:hypothetical protein
MQQLDEACRALDGAQAFALMQQVVHEFRAGPATQDWVVLQQG